MKLGQKIHCGFLLAFSWIAHSGVSQLLCHDTQADLWRGTCSENEAIRQQPVRMTPSTITKSEPSWRQMLHPQSTIRMTAASANGLTATLETLSQRHEAKLHPNSEIMFLVLTKF